MKNGKTAGKNRTDSPKLDKNGSSAAYIKTKLKNGKPR
jgi:hypothetical protein